MDHGPLSPYYREDIDNYCPMTKKTGQKCTLQKDLYDKVDRMYDGGFPNYITEEISSHLSHERVSYKFVCELDVGLHLLKCHGSPHYGPQKYRVALPPLQHPDRQAYVALQPWPPPIPTDPGCYGLSSAVKPVVYSPLPEGFKGGREISDTDDSLFISDPSFHFDGS